ncbi:LMBR1-like membrane protein-domain-containing protein [Zopfochytrium polystomum]|nr:LMBR1-like membrane protein-domain-containing protein [Zopfochytrium polystomum]
MILVVVLLAALAATVAALLWYFGNHRTFPWYVQVACFCAWLFPFSIILVLPLDLASNLHRRCEKEHGPENCPEPIAYVPEDFLWVFWRTLYWNMFCLTWFVIPIMQAWVRSGDFNSWPRFLNAVRANLIYYASVGTIGVAFLIYMIVSLRFRREDLVALLIAGANAWGLLVCTCMLGFGLVRIPRGLWMQANTAKCLRELEMKAPKAKETMVDSEAQIYELAREIAIASRRIGPNDPLRKYVDILMEKCPLSLDERSTVDEEEDTNPPTYEKLRVIHARIKYYTKVNERHQAQFRFLLHRAWLLNDIMDNEKNKDRRFQSHLIKPGPENYEDLKLQALWWWYIHVRPVVFRVLSVICGIASVALVWSESTFQVTSVPLSVPAWILKSGFASGVLELVAMSFLLYMCICAYSTLLKVKIFDYYVIMPEHHTDEPSLLFVGAYLCRLTFPLCYNFLNMASDDENSIFVKYQGKFIDLAPLLGERFNTWVPELVLIFSVLNFLNMYERILTWFNVRKFFYDEPAGEADIEDGRRIIMQARSAEERRLVRGSYISSSSYGLNSIESSHLSSSRGRNSSSRATNTSELLAKYKSGSSSTSSSTSSSSSSSSSPANSSRNTPPMPRDSPPPSERPSSPSFSLHSMLSFAKKSTSSTVLGGGSGGGRYERLEQSDSLLLPHQRSEQDRPATLQQQNSYHTSNRRFGAAPIAAAPASQPLHGTSSQPSSVMPQIRMVAPTGASAGGATVGTVAPVSDSGHRVFGARPSSTTRAGAGTPSGGPSLTTTPALVRATSPRPEPKSGAPGAAPSSKNGRRNLFDDI